MATNEYYVGAERQVDEAGLTEAMRLAIESQNAAYAASPTAFFRGLHGTLEEYEGLPFVHRRNGGDSTEEAFVFHSEFGGPVTPANGPDETARFASDKDSKRPDTLDSNRWAKLILVDLIYRGLDQAGVRDQNGDNIPVIGLSAPSLDFHPIKAADSIRALANSGLFLCDAQGYGRLHVGGASLGGAVTGDMVIEGVKQFDIAGWLSSENPSYQRRGFIDFVRAFVRDEAGLELSGSREDNGPQARTDIARTDADGNGEGFDAANYYGNGNARVQINLINGMRRDRTSGVLEVCRRRVIPVTAEFGEGSKMTLGILDYLHNNGDVNRLNLMGLYQELIARGESATHAHTQILPLMADIAVRSALLNKGRVSKDGSIK